MTLDVLIDHRLRLRPLSRDDAQPLFDLIDANRAHLRDQLDWVDAVTHVRHLHAFCRKRTRQAARGKTLVAVIELDHAPAGLIELHDIRRRQADAELGFWLSHAAQGRGVMARSARALLDHAFQHLQLRRVFAACGNDNLKSRRLLQRCGFQPLGRAPSTATRRGTSLDATVFELTPENLQ